MRKIIMLSLVLLTSIGMYAQHPEKKEKRALKKEFYESLSASQKETLDKHKALKKENRQALKSTFNDEQLKIVNNEDLSRIGKRKALKPTFSEKQLAMIDSHKEAMKANKEKFRATLNEQQKETFDRIQKQRKHKPFKKGHRKKKND